MREDVRRKKAREVLRRSVDIKQIMQQLEKLKPLDEWDWEELQRGYPRGPSGRFGKQPEWASLVVARLEVQDRLRQMTKSQISVHAGKALKTIVDLMDDDSLDIDGKPVVPPAVRLKAAEYVLDQTVGKATAIHQTNTDNFQNLLASCMVNDDGEDAHPVTIPGEVLYDEEDEDEAI
jgi:hypothetical protein